VLRSPVAETGKQQCVLCWKMMESLTMSLCQHLILDYLLTDIY